MPSDQAGAASSRPQPESDHEELGRFRSRQRAILSNEYVKMIINHLHRQRYLTAD
jgi:hypothetical protein